MDGPLEVGADVVAAPPVVTKFRATESTPLHVLPSPGGRRCLKTTLRGSLKDELLIATTPPPSASTPLQDDENKQAWAHRKQSEKSSRALVLSWPAFEPETKKTPTAPFLSSVPVPIPWMSCSPCSCDLENRETLFECPNLGLAPPMCVYLRHFMLLCFPLIPFGWFFFAGHTAATFIPRPPLHQLKHAIEENVLARV